MGIILIHLYQMAIVVLAVVICLFDSLRESRSVPLMKQSGIACFLKVPAAHWLEIAALIMLSSPDGPVVTHLPWTVSP